MPTVQMPDGSTAQFPDGMQPAEIQSAIEQHMSTAGKPAAAQSSPGLLDRARSLVDRASTVTPEELQPHNALTKASPLLNSAANQAAKFGAGVIGSTAGVLAHPIEAAKGFVKSVTPDPGAAGGFESLLGPAGPMVTHLVKSAVQEPAQTAGSLVGGTLLGEAGGGLARGVRNLPETVRATVAGDVTTPKPGMTEAPTARYQAAKRTGVQLDAADATQSPLLGNVKRVGENSLAGGHLYDNLKARNVAAVGSTADRLLNTMSPHGPEEGGQLVQEALRKPFRELTGRAGEILNQMSPATAEEGGADIQNALKADQERLKFGAQKGFSDLARRTGNAPLPGAPDVGRMAQATIDRESPYFERFPSFKPSRTMSVLGDVANLAKPPGEYTAGPGGSMLPPADWSTMHRLGSDIHSLYAENPDLIKTRAQSWLQQLEGKNGDVIRSAGEQLSPGLRSIFDKANADWADVKGTYDNPSSPFYHAVRTGNPSELVKGIGPKTPENAARLVDRLGPSGAIGSLRRGTVESALKPTPNGEPDLLKFGANLNRIPADYRAKLFTPEQTGGLSDLTSDIDYHAPYEKAAFKTPAAELVNGVGPETAANVRKLRGVIGDEPMGAIQRGVAERLMRTNQNGDYNFPTFGRQFHLVPDEYRGELFGEHEPALKDLATTSNTLTKDFNPSGSGKLNQKAGEAGLTGGAASSALLMGHPAALLPEIAYHAGQYGAGKLMTSPRVVDWLMRPQPRVAPGSMVAPAAVGAGVASRPQ